jgi:hypothetical protein
VRPWLVVAAAGCFEPLPHRGQTCASWCPPPEVCVNHECVAGAGSGSGSAMPVDANYMFVTSTTKAPKDVGGLAGADAWCNELAGAAGLPGQYVAWLSTIETDAKTRLLEKAARGWYRVDGKPFTDRVEDLTSNVSYYPPRISEQNIDLGTSDDVVVGTGTDINGSGNFLGADCSRWTSDLDAMISGVLDGGNQSWTYATNMTPCTTPIHIYCFGVDKTVTVPPPARPPDTRLAFVAIAMLGSGIAGLDATCQNAAQAAGVSGTFFAWTSTTGASAQSRISGTTPWRRPDNVVAMTPALELTAPIDLTLDGSNPTTYVWTGAAQPDALAPTPTASCNDWATTTFNISGIAGDSQRSVLAHAFGGATQACGSPTYVECLER